MTFLEIAKRMFGGTWDQIAQVGWGPVYAGLFIAAVAIPAQIYAKKYDDRKKREANKKIAEEAVAKTLKKTFERFEEIEENPSARMSLRAAMASMDNGEIADEVLDELEQNK